MRTSLQSRLAIGIAIPVAIATLLTVVLVSYGARQLVDDFVLTRLEHDLETLVAGVELSPNAPPHQGKQLTQVYQQPYSGHYFQIETEGSAPERSRSLWDHQLDLPDLEPGERRTFRTLGPEGQPLMMLIEGFSQSGQSAVVGVAEDIGPLTATVRLLQGSIAGLGVLLLGLIVLSQTALIRRGLAPVNALRQELQRLERGDIEELNADQVPREIRPLILEINQLIRLLSSRLIRSRNALGNLAHALKTPLTILDGLNENEPHSSDELHRQVAAMRNIVERELRRARLAGGGMPGATLAPETAISELVEVFTKVYAHKTIEFDIQITPELRLPLDREDFLELVGVLVDNACKWCHHRVRVTVEQSGEKTSLTVDDDGAGCPEEQRASLAKRGWRVDGEHPGSGLGLAIAADIVEQYNGRLSFHDSPLGGLQVKATLKTGRD
ncbi:signal transduction histidine kinase [Halospina denitrificans]|uniref:histidine kinase n=1 Tax=Halospina denitrificans TaxID=332522 RepID=A0A4R7JRB7_9GAMM|nr:ATP-binding protein [Halospina denitrificans]TDT40266.1 signal transduction histidine kinase [Halospina denitrificans]